MKDKINLNKCIRIKCKDCKFYNKCFKEKNNVRSNNNFNNNNIKPSHINIWNYQLNNIIIYSLFNYKYTNKYSKSNSKEIQRQKVGGG